MYSGSDGLKLGIGLFVVLIGWAGLAQAANVEQQVYPQEIKGAIKVSAEEVFTLFETTPGLVIIDSRLSSGRANGYIEGSISLPDIETNCTSLAKILPRKNSPTLYYCNGPKCGRSSKAIAVALKCGYSKIYWFSGGFEEWQSKGYSYIKP